MDDIEYAFMQRKNEFLDDVESSVEAYIISTGKHCIAIVQRNPDGSVHYSWDLRDDIDDFAKVLYHFIRKKQHKGYDLDSALSDPITEIVEKKYQAFYDSESDAISQGMLKALASDEVRLKKFVDRISQIALNGFSKEVQSQILDRIVDQVKESISDGALHHISHQISHVASTVAGTQIAAVVANILVKLLAMHMKVIVSKILASTLIKKMIAAMGKKIILKTVGVAVLHFLSVHLGAAIGSGAIMWIIIPAIVAYLGYKILTFPEKLGDKVSKSVRKDLAAEFENLNRTILEKIFEEVFEGNELVHAVSQDRSFQDALRKMGTAVEQSLEMNHATTAQEKKGSEAVVSVMEITPTPAANRWWFQSFWST